VRSWSSCSLSGDRNGRSSTGLVAMGVLSSGAEASESSSWLDRNPNQVEVEEFLWEMVADYFGNSCRTRS